MDQKERNEELWADASNWYYGHCIYWCPEDPRVWVPKPVKWTGWTLNFAHQASYWLLGSMLIPPLMILAAVALATALDGR